MRQQTPHPPEQQFRRHRAFFLVVKIDRSFNTNSYEKRRKRKEGQKAALQSERKNGKLGENRHNVTKKAAISDLQELVKCSTQCIACFSTATLHRDKGCIKAAIQHNKQYGYISINDPDC